MYAGTDTRQIGLSQDANNSRYAEMCLFAHMVVGLTNVVATLQIGMEMCINTCVRLRILQPQSGGRPRGYI